MSRKIIKRINLEEIENPEFLKGLKKKELIALSEDIREFIIKSVSKTGGHLSSNLGAVELEVALHYVFNEPNDKIIFDVGHQAYTHKILTGRANQFNTLRTLDGLSGYPSYAESKYDAWESGHSSTSISALEGYLVAQSMGHDIGRCVALIGDSAIANGVAFEALNNLGSHKYSTAPIIILNDNGMGISKTVGSLTRRLQKTHGSKFLLGLKKCVLKVTIPPVRRMFHSMNHAFKSLTNTHSIFGDIGFDYYGPYDGHNVWGLIKDLKRIKKTNRPVIIHILTKKGKGYKYAEEDKSGKYHSVGPFDIKTGEVLNKRVDGEYTYPDIVLNALYKERENTKFTIIDPAMVLGSDIERYTKKYPGGIMDVGISEEYGASLAGAITKAGSKAVVLYYSTFLQRAYDEVLNDVARPNIPVVFGIDRCGITGADGSTHNGIYDIAMLSSMPNMQIVMGMNGKETRSLVSYALKCGSPIAVRYTKGSDFMNLDNKIEEITPTWTKVCEGNIGICITYGPDVTRIKDIIIDNKLSITLINARFIKPMDLEMLEEAFNSSRPILVYEQVVRSGSLYEKIIDYKNKFSKISKVVGIYIDDDTVVRHGEASDVLNAYGLGDEDILKELHKLYEA